MTDERSNPKDEDVEGTPTDEPRVTETDDEEVEAHHLHKPSAPAEGTYPKPSE